MSGNDFTLGKNKQAVLICGDGTRIDLSNLTSFEAKPEMNKVVSKVLAGPRREKHVYDGWTGTIALDRENNDLDSLIAKFEAAFWLMGGTTQDATLFEYITELNLSTSSYMYSDVALSFDTGTWKSDSAVDMKITFFARRKQQLS
jgi:hypothetical protein